MEIISSLDNERVKFWNKLNTKKFRDSENLFLVEGDHLVIEALKIGCIKEVIMDSEKLFPFDVFTHYVTKEVMAKITCMQTIPDIIAVCYKKEATSYGDKLLLIDALQDPGNLGTIIRSATAFGINTIILGDNTVDLYNDKTIRSSEGMMFHIDVIKANLSEFIPRIKNEDYKVFGTNVESGKLLSEIMLRSKYAFIVGNEGAGVSGKLLELCDENIYIPMSNKCESLNVAVATGIILYEMSEKYNGWFYFYWKNC